MAAMAVGVSAAGSGLSAIRSVDVFSRILHVAAAAAAEEEVTGLRRVWLAAVASRFLSPRRRKDRDNIIIIIILCVHGNPFAYSNVKRMENGEKQ